MSATKLLGTRDTQAHWLGRIAIWMALLSMLASSLVIGSAVPTLAVEDSFTAQAEGPLKKGDVSFRFRGVTPAGDEVTSLESSHGFECGDVVEFRTYVEIAARAAAGPHTIQVTHEFGQDPGGANHGVGFRWLEDVELDATRDGLLGDVTSVFPGDRDQDGEVVVEISGLQPGDEARIDLHVGLGCDAPPVKLAGNVHTGLGEATANPGTDHASDVSPGGQTVPLKVNGFAAELTIEKVTDPQTRNESEPPSFDFEIRPEDGTDKTSFDLSDGESEPFVLFSGTWEVEETELPPGWALDSITCDEGSWVVDLDANQVSVELVSGDDVTCTFTNDQDPVLAPQEATITVVKEVTAGSDQNQEFAFTGDVEADLAHGGSASESVVPGTYEVTETVPDGWELDSIVCDDNGDSGRVGDTSTARFVVADGDDVTCTFTNHFEPVVEQEEATITVVKVVTVDSDQTQTFAFTGDVEADLAHGGSASETVVPGTYEVTETVPDDWVLVSVECVGNAGSHGDVDTATATFDVADGDDVTCTFTNDFDPVVEIASGDLVVSKAVDGPVDDGTAFGFTVACDDDDGTARAFTLEAGQEEPFTGIDAGTECVVTETDPAGAVETTVMVDGESRELDEDRSVTVEVGDGTTVEVAFTNRFEVEEGVLRRVIDPAPVEDAAPAQDVAPAQEELPRTGFELLTLLLWAVVALGLGLGMLRIVPKERSTTA